MKASKQCGWVDSQGKRCEGEIIPDSGVVYPGLCHTHLDRFDGLMRQFVEKDLDSLSCTERGK